MFAYSALKADWTFEHNNFPLQKIWSRKLNGNIEGISKINGKLVFVRTNKAIYAIELESGEPLWHHDLAWQAIPEPAITSDHMVIFADGNAIWNLSQSDGSVLWRQSVSKSDRHVKDASANIVAVKVEQDLNIYNAFDGSLQWSKSVCRNDIQAYIHENIVYVPCYGIRAIDISTGENVWEIQNSERLAKVAYDDGVMFFSPDQLSLVAFDLQNRNKLWEMPLHSKGFTQFKVAENIVFLTDANQFCAIEKKDGVILWCTEIASPQNPTLLGNIVYIFDVYHKEITALDVSTGKELGKLTANKFSIAIVYKELMVSTEDFLIFGIGNKVFAFGE